MFSVCLVPSSAPISKYSATGFFAKAGNPDMNVAGVGQQLATQKAKLDFSPTR
jgi:hypothetical protein